MTQSQRFRVVGVNRQSGQDTELTVEAVSEANARVKTELRGIVVTAISPQAQAASDVSSSPATAPGRSPRPTGDLSQRWPWRRVAKWLYNWRLLVSVWLIMSLLACLPRAVTIVNSGPMLEAWPSPARGVMVVTALAILAGSIYCYGRIVVLFGRDPYLAGNWLNWVLIAEIILLGLLLVLSMSDVRYAVEFPLHEAASRVALLLLARPLLNSRFAEFSQLFQALSFTGVPRSFIVRQPFVGRRREPPFDARMPYIVTPNEPMDRMGSNRLLRGIAVGSVIVPPVVSFAGDEDAKAPNSAGCAARSVRRQLAIWPVRTQTLVSALAIVAVLGVSGTVVYYASPRNTNASERSALTQSEQPVAGGAPNLVRVVGEDVDLRDHGGEVLAADNSDNGHQNLSQPPLSNESESLGRDAYAIRKALESDEQEMVRELSLNGTAGVGPNGAAIINGQFIRVGQTVGRFTLTKVLSDRVCLQVDDRQYELLLPKLQDADGLVSNPISRRDINTYDGKFETWIR